MRREISHTANMARRGKPISINWYLREWMDTVIPVARGRQAKMAKLTGWSKATTSQLYNNEQDYSPKVVNEASKALEVEPWELLMPPEKAMRLRRIQEDLIKLAHDAEATEPTKLLDQRPSRTNKKADPAKRGTGTHG